MDVIKYSGKFGFWKTTTILIKLICAFFLVSWLFVGCTTVEDTPEPTSMEPVAITRTGVLTTVTPTLLLSTPLPSATELLTHTPTSLPTNTPIPYRTVQSFPTVTPVGVYPVKQVFIQAGWTSGDGGRGGESIYYGIDTPNFVIYTDGQIILKVDDQDEGDTFLSGQLPENELCSLLTRLEATGYFKPFDTYYDFDETTEFSEGASSYLIQVNGPFVNYKYLYSRHLDYLVDEIAAAYQFITTYQPPIILSAYIPETLLLWVEPNNDLALASLPEWPTDLPTLSELRADPSSSQVTVSRELIPLLMALFDNRMSLKQFREDVQAYDVILRPLLPNETPNDFSFLLAPRAEFNLPFPCDNIDLPEIVPTPTPTPLTGTPATEIGALRGRIVFSSNMDGNDEIYVMYADGSHLTRLTNYPGKDTEPAWSPDGQQIAFVSDRSGRDEIYTMNADGTGVTRLTFSSSNKGAPAWSPDGTRIVYVDSPLFDSEIYLIGINDNEPIQLTNNGDRVGDVTPIWLDSNRIIYASGDYPNYNLYTMQDDGTDKLFLTTGSQPALSPNGEQLVYVVTNFVTSESGSTRYFRRVFIASITDLFAGKAIRSQITEVTMSNYSPAWSPDGQHIIFVSSRDGNAELYVAAPDGSNPLRLTYTAAGEQSPDWAP